MKRYIFLSAIFSIIALSALADNILLLTHPKTKETNVFREGSYLVFQLKADGSMHEGFIREIQDSSLVFDQSQVSLSQINIYAGSTKAKIVAGRVAHAVGNTLLFTGMTVFDFGLNVMLYNDYYYWPIGGSIWLAGAFIAGLGHIFDWAISPPDRAVRVRNYKEWSASIINEEQPVIANSQKVQQPSDTTLKQVVPAVPAKGKRSKVTKDDVYGD